MALYDRIGQGYSSIRRPDPRFAEQIWAALGDARSVVNVGAGAGSYEPIDREVVAVEPSAVMIAQRPPGAARAVQANAEALPFDDDSFDAALAILTLHHWSDVEAGLAELTRIARHRVVIMGFDSDLWSEQWIVRDYLPEVAAWRHLREPTRERLLAALPPATVERLLCPNDCTDRMFATLWARPEQYLDPQVRAATSVWDQLPPEVSARALDQLRRDLESGEWDRRYGHLRTTPQLDVGLRLISAELSK
ncbi:MAG TPA: class I SAM-dependent methyltransferase [Gaiellaceae bacterium]|nr:class I SAM-dependent methyltransferase [Gaiellaceae bacterium]